VRLEMYTRHIARMAPSDLDVTVGRPNLETLINNFIDTADEGERVAVAAYGPVEISNTVRKTVVGRIGKQGAPRLELSCELFGW
jgi:hypothetical protein